MTRTRAFPLRRFNGSAEGDRSRFFFGGDRRRDWLRAARAAGGTFRSPSGDETMLALRAAVRDGGSLLEEYAVRSTVRSLLAQLANGQIQPATPAQVVPGVLVEVISLNTDGSASVACISWSAP
ncbi:hypothetical protein [Pseudoclavibacter sp. AY1H1]|uniref:hypothetical protein n=1 Tax=Pseudoclavibacter sp. AY1H1 TaxID=2080584 RepID=UPI000CE90D48|nr:hypothetical protein [Pseudoclavibacter sp. AY1H1]PPF32615.1 hypothetical protein C5E05_19110 [Pseudoclavibacter sp. AY1H1]